MESLDIQSTFSLEYLVNLGIALAISVAFILSVYYMFSGAISMILSGGQEDKIKEAVNTIRYSVIGLVVTVLAVVFIFMVGNLFGVSLNEYINFDRMIEIMTGLIERIANGPNS